MFLSQSLKLSCFYICVLLYLRPLKAELLLNCNIYVCCSLSMLGHDDGVSALQKSEARLLYSHNGDLDELLEESGPLGQVHAQTQLRHHPVLHLVEATDEALQVGRGGVGEFLPPENIVQQLSLRKEMGGGG